MILNDASGVCIVCGGPRDAGHEHCCNTCGPCARAMMALDHDGTTVMDTELKPPATPDPDEV